MRYQKQSNILL